MIFTGISYLLLAALAVGALAVLLVPVCLNMAGVGNDVAGWLGFR